MAESVFASPDFETDAGMILSLKNIADQFTITEFTDAEVADQLEKILLESLDIFAIPSKLNAYDRHRYYTKVPSKTLANNRFQELYRVRGKSENYCADLCSQEYVGTSSARSGTCVGFSYQTAQNSADGLATCWMKKQDSALVPESQDLYEYTQINPSDASYVRNSQTNSAFLRMFPKGKGGINSRHFAIYTLYINYKNPIDDLKNRLGKPLEILKSTVNRFKCPNCNFLKNEQGRAAGYCCITCKETGGREHTNSSDATPTNPACNGTNAPTVQDIKVRLSVDENENFVEISMKDIRDKLEIIGNNFEFIKDKFKKIQKYTGFGGQIAIDRRNIEDALTTGRYRSLFQKTKEMNKQFSMTMKLNEDKMNNKLKQQKQQLITLQRQAYIQHDTLSRMLNNKQIAIALMFFLVLMLCLSISKISAGEAFSDIAFYAVIGILGLLFVIFLALTIYSRSRRRSYSFDTRRFGSFDGLPTEDVCNT